MEPIHSKIWILWSGIITYSGLCGFVGNKGEFSWINVHFAFCWFVGIRGENYFRSFGRIPAPSVEGIRKFHEVFSPERNKPAPESWIVSEQTTQRSFLEQDSTTVPNFANRSFCPMGILLGLPPQARLFAACAAWKNPPTKGGSQPWKDTTRPTAAG